MDRCVHLMHTVRQVMHYETSNSIVARGFPSAHHRLESFWISLLLLATLLGPALITGPLLPLILHTFEASVRRYHPEMCTSKYTNSPLCFSKKNTIPFAKRHLLLRGAFAHVYCGRRHISTSHQRTVCDRRELPKPEKETF